MGGYVSSDDHHVTSRVVGMSRRGDGYVREFSISRYPRSHDIPPTKMGPGYPSEY